MDIAVAANMATVQRTIIVDEYKSVVRIIFTDGERQLFAKQQFGYAKAAMEKMDS